MQSIFYSGILYFVSGILYTILFSEKLKKSFLSICAGMSSPSSDSDSIWNWTMALATIGLVAATLLLGLIAYFHA